MARKNPAALALDQLYRLGQVLGGGAGITGDVEGLADVEGNDVRAFARELDGVRPTHTACGAGDERDLTIEIAHVIRRLSES